MVRVDVVRQRRGDLAMVRAVVGVTHTMPGLGSRDTQGQPTWRTKREPHLSYLLYSRQNFVISGRTRSQEQKK